MKRYVFKLPDLGEGTVEAELIAWHVKPGDVVKEDQVIAEVMTEKAAVELPSPVAGRVDSVTGSAGEILKVGAELIVFETDAAVESGVVAATSEILHSPPADARRIMASPATRRRAHDAGVDLAQVRGSGPGGRITPDDLIAASSPATTAPVVSLAARPASERTAPTPPTAPAPRQGTEEIKVTGLRRVIAQRMSESKRTIPHFSYVEEIDVTELESLRAHLNERGGPGATSLSYLPFIVVALTRALERFPQCNSLYDAERNVIVRHRTVHLGIATQTPEGLLVPVLRNAEALSITQIASQIRDLAERARLRKSPREELTGSTITLSSLGKLGGIASTPVINAPEVAIIGVNRSVERPMFVNGAVVARRLMNLSSSFDHRFVDGYDAASMIQEMKQMLEHPATLFM